MECSNVLERFANLSLDKDGAIVTTKKKSQAAILTFAMETPRYTFTQRPSPPTKRPLAAKRGPGRPRKVRQQEDWTQLWYDAVESEQYSWGCFECGNPMKQRMLATSLIRQQQQQRICLPCCRAPFHRINIVQGVVPTLFDIHEILRIAEGNMNSAFSSSVAMSCLCWGFASHVNLPLCSVK